MVANATWKHEAQIFEDGNRGAWEQGPSDHGVCGLPGYTLLEPALCMSTKFSDLTQCLMCKNYTPSTNYGWIHKGNQRMAHLLYRDFALSLTSAKVT